MESSCGELLWRGARPRGAATPRGRGRPCCRLRKKRIRRKVGPEAVLKGCPRAEAAQGAEIQLLLKCAYHRRGGPNMSRTCMYLATECSKVEKRDHLEHRILRNSGRVPGNTPPPFPPYNGPQGRPRPLTPRPGAARAGNVEAETRWDPALYILYVQTGAWFPLPVSTQRFRLVAVKWATKVGMSR